MGFSSDLGEEKEVVLDVVGAGAQCSLLRQQVLTRGVQRGGAGRHAQVLQGDTIYFKTHNFLN